MSGAILILSVAVCLGLCLAAMPSRPAKRRKYQWPEIVVPRGMAVWAKANPKALREKIAELTDRVTAITDLAEAEKRELTVEDKTEIDGILGKGKKGEAGYQAGQIDALEVELERAEKIEAQVAKLAQGRAGGSLFQRAGQPIDGGFGFDEEAPRVARVRIPLAAQFRYGTLKAYKGRDAERSAYLAGNFFLATLFGNTRAQKWCKDFGVDCNFQNSLSEGTDSAGGFLVPTEVEQAVIDLREQYGVFRRNAAIVPMARDTKTQPVRASGPTATWVGENQEITGSDKAWKQLNLVARKLASMVRYSKELAEDATISIGDDLTREFAYAFAVAEDQAGFIGDGTATYGHQVGLKNIIGSASIHEALAGNTAFGTLDLADFVACVGKLPDIPGLDPAWYISKPGAFNSMVNLMAAAGGNDWETLENGRRVRLFLGYPIEYVHVMPKALTATPSTILAYFGDLRMAAILGNRRGLEVTVSDQRYWEFNQIGIMGTQRCTVATVPQVASTTEAGPIIALKTPAA